MRYVWVRRSAHIAERTFPFVEMCCCGDFKGGERDFVVLSYFHTSLNGVVKGEDQFLLLRRCLDPLSLTNLYWGGQKRGSISISEVS